MVGAHLLNPSAVSGSALVLNPRERTQSTVDRFRVWESLRHVAMEHDDVRSLMVPFGVLASDALGKSYSGSMSALSDPFFIDHHLAPPGTSHADDPMPVSAIRMDDHQHVLT
jgi:hypothetical protein